MTRQQYLAMDPPYDEPEGYQDEIPEGQFLGTMESFMVQNPDGSFRVRTPEEGAPPRIEDERIARPGGKLVSRGKEDPQGSTPAEDDSGFTSSGRKETPHWRDQARAAGVDPESLIVREPKQNRERAELPEERYWQPGFLKEVRRRLGGLGSRPAESDTNLLAEAYKFVDEGGRLTPEDMDAVAAAERRIAWARADEEAVQAIQRALSQGDSKALKQHMARFKRFDDLVGDL